LDLETRIKISSDTSGLSKIAAESKKAFSPLSPKELKKTSKELLDQFNLLAKAQLNLVKAMSGVERGTKEYKKLVRELKDVKVQGDAVLSVLKNINQVTERTAHRRSSFVAGLGQGLGIAQYMPSGPGMVSRMGGAMAGGAVRRTMGAASSMFLTPGVGGMAGALSAIPWVGQGLANILQAGQGYYQQAMQFSASKLPNVPYADLRSVGSLYTNPERVAAENRYIGVYEKQRHAERQAWRAQVAISQIDDRARAAGGYFEPPEGGMGKAEYSEAGGGFHAKGSPYYAPPRSKRVIAARGGTYDDIGHFWARPARGEQTAAQAKWREADAEAKKYNKLMQEEEKSLRATPVKLRQDVMGIPGAGFGVPFGFSPEETQQWFGSFMGARGGLSNRGFLHGQFRESMAVGRLYGVSPEQAGGFHRMQMPGGGGEAAGIGLVMEQIRAMGLQGSQAADYLQTMVEQGKRAEDRGLKINIHGMTETGMFLRAAGLQGAQLGRVTGGITAAYSNMAMTGVQTPAQVAMLRAAGWTPEQGTEGYFKTLAELEGGPGQETLERIMGTVAQTAAAGRGPWEAGGLFARFFTQGTGTPMGPTMGKELMEQFKGGKLSQEGWEKYSKMMTQADIESGKVVPEAIRGASRIGGLAKAGYGLQAEQIGIGGQLAGTFMALDRAGAKSVQAMARFSGELEGAANVMLKVMKGVDKAAQRIEKGGLWAFIISAFGGS